MLQAELDKLNLYWHFWQSLVHKKQSIIHKQEYTSTVQKARDDSLFVSDLTIYEVVDFIISVAGY